MATGTAGSSARVYHTQQVHYLRKTVGYSEAGDTVTVGVIPSGSVILYPASGFFVATAFNGSGTDLVDIGTSADGDLFATDLDVSSVGFKALDENVAGLRVSADTTITASYADANSDASAGEGEVIVCFIPDNDG